MKAERINFVSDEQYEVDITSPVEIGLAMVLRGNLYILVTTETNDDI